MKNNSFKLAFALSLWLSGMAQTVWSQNLEDAKTKMLNMLNSSSILAGAVSIESSELTPEGQGQKLSGKMTFFDVAGVEYATAFSQHGTPLAFVAAPGATFKFAKFNRSLTVLDKLSLRNMAIALSSDGGDVKNLLPVFSGLGAGNATVGKGLTFMAWLNLNDLNNTVGKLSTDANRIPIDNVLFRGNLPDNPMDITMQAALNFKNIEIGNFFYFRNLTLTTKPINNDPEFSIAADIGIRAESNKKPLEFRGGFGVKPVSASVTVGGALLNEWKDPYGFPGLSVGPASMTMGLNFSTMSPAKPFPDPDNISLSGTFKIGNTNGTATVGFDSNDPLQNMVAAKVDNLSWRDLTGHFCGSWFTDKINELAGKIPLLKNAMFESQLKNLEIKMVPKDFTTYDGNTISAGFRIAAAGIVSGWSGDFLIELDGFSMSRLGGFTAKGKMDPIQITANGHTIFSLSGVNSKKPELLLDLSYKHLIQGISGIFKEGGDADAVGAVGPKPEKPEERIAYTNVGINVLGIASNNALIELTPLGYKCNIEGKVYGILDASLEARISQFANPLQNTYVVVSGKPGIFVNEINKFITSEVLGLGVKVESIKFEGNLDMLQSGARVNVVFSVAGLRRTVGVDIRFGDAGSFFRRVADEIVKTGMPVVEIAEEVVQTAQTAQTAAENTVKEAVQKAQATREEMAKTTNELKITLSNGAKDAYNASVQGITEAINFSEKYLKDFADITENLFGTIWKNFQNIEKWDDLGDVGGIQRNRIKTAGPAYLIHSYYPGYILQTENSQDINHPIFTGPNMNRPQDRWQLIPTSKNSGYYYIVSTANGLNFNLDRDNKREGAVIRMREHKSKERDNERIKLIPVPGEPGWYYLRVQQQIETSGDMYVVLNGDPQTGSRSSVHQSRAIGNRAKFRLERVGDIKWANGNAQFTSAAPLAEKTLYQAEGDPQVFLYTANTRRWIPDMETLRALNLDPNNIKNISADRLYAIPLGPQIPSRKDGSPVQANGAKYVMESGKRRHIPDMETFHLMGLQEGWFQTISEAEMNGIPLGQPLPSKFEANAPLMDKLLYNVAGDPRIYTLQNNTFRHIPDPETLRYLGYAGVNVRTITAQELGSLSQGATVPTRRDGAFVQCVNDPKIYVMEKGLRRWIPDPETYNVLRQSNTQAVQQISVSDLTAIPEGPALFSLK